MYKYTDIDKHTFLSPYWCDELHKAGIKMSDAMYCLATKGGDTFVIKSSDVYQFNQDEWKVIPTYTLSEMLYKMDEYPYVEIDEDEYRCWGGLDFTKDAPFYIFGYYPEKSEYIVPEKRAEYEGKNYLDAIAETPIEAAAKMLIKSVKAGISLVDDITKKYEETKMK